MFFCKHNFIESTDGDNVYCTKCGKIKTLPCNHKYILGSTIKDRTYGDRVSNIIYVLQCTKCGRMRKESIA